jgi:type IV fimbrial biogenesis protein FimT
MMNRPARSSLGGFTLVELLVTMAIAAVLLAIAVPAFRDFTATQKVKSTAFEVAAAMLMARSEAVKRNSAVTVTPVTSGDWTSGWAVASGTTTIHAQQAFTGVTLTGPTSVSFNATGRPGAAVTFEVNATGSTVARCVRVDTTGIPSTKSEACS